MKGQSEAPDQVDFLSFTLGRHGFIVPLSKIQEVLTVPELTPLPETSSYVEGVAEIRGKILPVVSLRRQLQMADPAQPERAKILVVRGPEHNVGFLVDNVSDVVPISAAALELTATEIPDGILSDYLMGVAKTDRGVLLIIDFEKLLDLKSIESVYEQHEEKRQQSA